MTLSALGRGNLQTIDHKTAHVPISPPESNDQGSVPDVIIPLQEKPVTQTRHLHIDHSGTFQLKLTYDSAAGSVRHEWLFNAAMLPTLQRLRETLCGGLRATVTGKGPDVVCEIFLFDLLLQRRTIDLSTLKEHVLISNQLSSYDLRRINQVGKEYLSELKKRKRVSEPKMLTCDLHTHCGVQHQLQQRPLQR